jgi:hypothetical protein
VVLRALAIPVRCVGTRGRRCVVRLVLRVRGVVVGSRRVALRAGRRRAVVVPVDARGLALLGSDSRLRLDLSLTARYPT